MSLPFLRPNMRKILPGSKAAILSAWNALVGGGETHLHTHAASDITSGTLAINRGGTAASTASVARTNLGSTTVGDAVFIAANAAAGRTALGLGSIATENTPLGITVGGTGQATATAAFTALSPLTTKGDILSDNGTNPVRVAVGTDGQYLKADSSASAGVSWATFPITQLEMLMHFGATVWTNMPAALTELFGATANRRKLDATGYTQFRINGRHSVVGAAGSKLYLQYSTDNVSFSDAESGGHSSGDYALDGTVSTPLTTTWVNLATGAKADVYWRIVGVTGNGAADPNITSLAVQFR